MDANRFTRNVSSHSLEELAPYQGKHVAWTEDGTRVLAAADTLADLYKELDRRGLRHYVIDFIPDASVSDF
ncbi:MAG TPA: DUF5678 domain-containing protein [Gemmataceae bacterium]|nr:DUF5678 domain-containing protein [Gemmataceae bacterium]